MAGLYIHIPFCKQACHYCDFHFSTLTDQRYEMVQSMITELEIRKSYLADAPLETIYFGGGTPSILDTKQLESILAASRRLFHVVPEAELTVECNPDDLSPSILRQLVTLGVNRLSIGIQSFDDAVLKYFNRAHNSAESLKCISEARAAGFENISIDLIYGIPGQDSDAWLKNIRKATALEPEHISAYALTIEEKTVFGRKYAKGQLTPLPEEHVAAQFELLMLEMEAAGYEHYEISNFAKPGRRSKHNTSYWEQKPYLGIGPSAHSYDGTSRQFNVANNSLYIKSIREGRIPFEKESLGRETLINEFIMTSLRTSGGLDLEKLKELHGFDLLAAHGSYVDTLVRLGKVGIAGNIMKLSNQGKLLADKISSDLFVITE
jgi:oxygen-independent coproporphyrinogen-3 oxidase